jgi:hypothetical protein
VLRRARVEDPFRALRQARVLAPAGNAHVEAGGAGVPERGVAQHRAERVVPVHEDSPGPQVGGLAQLMQGRVQRIRIGLALGGVQRRQSLYYVHRARRPPRSGPRASPTQVSGGATR